VFGTLPTAAPTAAAPAYCNPLRKIAFHCKQARLSAGLFVPLTRSQHDKLPAHRPGGHPAPQFRKGVL
jgi:hypothetical protein